MFYKNKKGVTIIELLAVIVITGILLAVSFVAIGSLINRTKLSLDETIVDTLNKATELYRMTEGSFYNDAFKGLATNNERINKLFESGHLSSLPTPSSPLIVFDWIIADQKWVISTENSSDDAFTYSYDFTKDRLIESNYVYVSGNYTDQGSYILTNHGLLLFSNPKETYTISVTARLRSHDSNLGGYGIFFDMSIDDQNRETGYILQFDRGFSGGELLIRQRYVNTNGQVRETVPPLYRHAIRFVDGELSYNVGQKDATNPWWTEIHDITLVVSLFNTENSNKKLDVYVDGIFYFSFFFMSNFTGNNVDNNLTGFRVWTSQTEFYSLSIS